MFMSLEVELKIKFVYYAPTIGKQKLLTETLFSYTK